MADTDSKPAVLVPQADALGMLAVIRSLGRAGYQVHAVSTNKRALGLRSRFAFRSSICPDYASADFLPWLRGYVEKHRLVAIIPSEGFLLAVMEQLEEFSHLMPIPADKAVVIRCFSKAETMRHFQHHGGAELLAAMPACLVIQQAAELDALADSLGDTGPFFLKGDAILGRRGIAPGVVRKAEDLSAAKRIATDLLDDYREVLIQAPAVGCKATVNVCLHHGRVLASSMCLSTHESPHQGGLTVLRHSWWHEAMYQDALQRMRCLEWDGVAMVEYKWDAATESFQFIEANTRFWAALHLDLFAGTDFPMLQLRAFLEPSPPVPAPRQALGVVCRHTVPGEIGHLLTTLRDDALPASQKISAFITFCLLFMHPGIHRDLLFPGDRRLYWYQWYRFLAELGRSSADNDDGA